MAEQEDQYRSTPLPLRQPDAPPPPEPGVLPIDYNVRSGDSSRNVTITPKTGSVGLASDPPGVAISPPEGDLSSPIVKSADDVIASNTVEARQRVVSAVLRPVEVMLRDPLGEVARKERRSLLGISGIAILVGWTGLIPAKIENFGISFTVPERKALLSVFFWVVGYYLVAFIIYAWSDFLSYLHAQYVGREELRRERQRSDRGEQPVGIPPWRWGNLVPSASVVRGLFDFFVPVFVAGYAMCLLWGAHTAQVATTAPAGPTAATAPASSLKAAPPAPPAVKR